MSGQNWLGAAGDFISFYTGYIPHVQQWDVKRLAVGYGPWVVKRFVGAIARPRISMRGLPISLS